MGRNITCLNEDCADVIRQFFEDICYCLHQHEVDIWRNCPGTIQERSSIALQHAREGLALLKGKMTPHEARKWLAERIGRRDLAASGGIMEND